MGKVIVERIVDAPVAAVWGCLNDIERTPEWVVGLEAAEVITDEPFGLGTIYVDHNRLGPLPQVTPWRITVFEPMTRQAHVSESAALPSTITFLLALDRLLMNRLLKRVIAQNLARLNDYLADKDKADVLTPAAA